MVSQLVIAIAAALLLAPTLPTKGIPKGAVKPLPTKKTKGKTKAPKPKPGVVSDKVTSIPAPRSDSKIYYVSPHAFTFTGDLFHLDNESLWPNRQTSAGATIERAAWTQLQLPVGAKIRSFDCQVRVVTVDASKPDKNVNVDVALFRTPYANPVRQNLRYVQVRAKDGPGKYWKRTEFPPTAEFSTISDKYAYAMDVRIRNTNREDVKFQGCRIEYE